MSKMDKILNFNPQTYYDNAIIREPSHTKTRSYRMIVDSRERNRTLFPNPNNYEINIIEDIQNVMSVNLLHADFPFDFYLVHKNNNFLILAYNSVVYNISVDIGNYTAVELATELTNALNTATSTSDFLVEYNARKDNYVFRCVNAFGLVFRGKQITQAYNQNRDTLYPEKSIGSLLGFGITNYISVNLPSLPDAYKNVIQSEFKKNFALQDCIIVRVEELELNKSTANSINDCFAIITKSSKDNFESKKDYISKTFHPALKKLTKLKFKFVDFDGNPIDFQNQDHRFELRILCDH
jgi:hypothetical protein